jgi:hypothetical protein
LPAFVGKSDQWKSERDEQAARASGIGDEHHDRQDPVTPDPGAGDTATG